MATTAELNRDIARLLGIPMDAVTATIYLRAGQPPFVEVVTRHVVRSIPESDHTVTRYTLAPIDPAQRQG